MLASEDQTMLIPKHLPLHRQIHLKMLLLIGKARLDFLVLMELE
jgi:hypothetical protein